MKKTIAILLTLVTVLSLMTGCVGNNTGDTQPSTVPTQESTMEPTQLTTQQTEPTQAEPGATGTATTSSAQLLGKIWTEYGENERFACYGGTVEHSVADAPGDLDMANTEEITNKYLLSQEQLENVESGASLVHLMNSNIFTAAAFKLKDGADARTTAKALRDNIQKMQWICGQPDHLLVAQAQGHLVMCFAAKEAMDTFRQKVKTVYADATIIYDEAVTA